MPITITHETSGEAIRGVLLDIDGTLLDSNEGHAAAWADAFNEAGIWVKSERLLSLIGKGGDKVLKEIAGIEKDSKEGKSIAERQKTLFKERYLPKCRPFPGARQLVERLQRDGRAVVVATSASGDELDDLLRAAGVQDLIDNVASSKDADRSKPDPDIILAAIERSKLAPEELLMVGDTPYDVEAATKAGVATVAVRSGKWSDAALAGAVAVYDDTNDLMNKYDLSPLGPRGMPASAR